MRSKLIIIPIFSILLFSIHAQEVNILLVNGYNSEPIKDFRMKFVDKEGNMIDTLSSNDNGELKYGSDQDLILLSDQELEYFQSFPISISSGGVDDTIVCYFYPTPQAEVKIRSWEEKYPGKRLKDLSLIDDTLILEEDQSAFFGKNIQEDTISEKSDSNIVVFENVTESSFPGGRRNMDNFLMENIQYPDISLVNSESGKVYIQFVVEKNGLVSQIKVMRGVSPAIDAEAKRVFRKMLKWNPAFSNGKAVRVKMTLMVNFSLR